MVALLVGLKAQLLRRNLSGPGRQRVAFVVVSVLALLFTAPVCLVLALAGGAELALARALSVIVGVSLMFAWVWLPLFLTGTDDALSPGRFALLPLSARQLMPGLYVAGLLGLGSGLTVLVGLSNVVGWSSSPPVLLSAVLGTALGIVTATLIPHVLTTAFAGALGSRRFRDVTGLAVVGFAVLVTIALQGATSALRRADGPDAVVAALDQAATALSWTPFGAAWVLPADVALGDLGGLAGHAALALGTLAALVAGWWLALRRALTTPTDVPDVVGRVTRENAIDRWLSGSRTAVIAGRLLRYYRRDPRRLLSVFSMMLAPVLVGVSVAGLTAAGGRAGGSSLLIVAPLLGMLLGPTLAFDISYDDSALWLHLTTSVKGWEDRLGRLLGFGAVALPIVALVLVLGVVATGGSNLVPFAAATIALTGAALGVGSYLGSVIQVSVPPPGSNPFGKGSGGGPMSVVVTLLTVVLALVFGAPALVVAALSYSHGWAWFTALPVAVATALGMVTWGVVTGGRRLDRRWPEVLREVTYRR